MKEKPSPGIKKSKAEGKERKSYYNIGLQLLNFMLERKWLTAENLSTNAKPPVSGTGSPLIDKTLFLVCNFNLSLLPLIVNLPMVSKPKDWKLNKDGLELVETIRISEISGAFLSLIPSSQDSKMTFKKGSFVAFCNFINGYQKQGFRVNRKLLTFIRDNRQSLERRGILLPQQLAQINLKEAFSLLKTAYNQNEVIKGASTLSYIMTEFSIRVQKARYQEMVIAIAEAFQNFFFFQPAFLDSHAYIISAGLFDLHRGDLVRGLIVFDNMLEIRASDEELRDIVATSVAFNYKSFVDNESALYWTKELSVWGFELAEHFILLVAYAKAPYQFLAKVLCDDQELLKLPISQEATACSYQLYTFFLLKTEVAIRTNLLPSNDGKLQDLYSELPREFKDFLRHRFDYYEFIEYKFDQQLIKTVFQLLIQGKRAKDIEVEIKNAYGVFLSDSAAETLSMQFVAFWNLKFPGITNLMKLIDLVGCLCFERERPVHISTHFITKRLDSRSSTCSQFIKLMHSSLILKVLE